METKKILNEIRKLSLMERLLIIEKTAKAIQTDDEKKQMQLAAEQLYEDYKEDPELTAFLALDLESFYETR